jgi:two-component system phosphate regulon response regulator PhoB
MPRRVLVVDDDAGMRRLLQVTLQQIQCTAILAEDGETALSLVHEQQPDAVLLDVNLPGLDGIQVCRAIRGHPATAKVPVIMLTGRGDEEAEANARAAGASAYLVKPSSPKIVKKVVLELIGR